MVQAKRRKIMEDKRKAREQRDDRCQYFLEKKRRFCSMQRKKNEKYCLEHMIHDESSPSSAQDQRIRCPLDGTHSVWKKDLEFHLRKCNAKPKEVHDPWYHLNKNIRLTNDDKHEFTPCTLSEVELYKKYIPLVQDTQFEDLELKNTSHSALDVHLEGLKNQKHILQQSSLIGHLRDFNMLSTNNYYMEYGCGKGELSKYVNECALHDMNSNSSEGYGYGFIDRGVNRMKVDSKIVKECELRGVKPLMRRSRIDIKDLDVNEFLKFGDDTPGKIVVISKHLCGAATDLTLKSLLNSNVFENGHFKGLLIAMCCRHVCDYEQLLPQSREYLASKGFAGEEALQALRKMVSWAISGSREREGKDGLEVEVKDVKNDKKESLQHDELLEQNDQKDAVQHDDQETHKDQKDSAQHVLGEIDSLHPSNKTFQERTELGYKARRLIDESRRHALQVLLPDFKVELFSYTYSSTTPENVGLVIRQKS